MSPKAMQETLHALKSAVGHASFQIKARRDLGDTKRAEEFEVRAFYIREALQEVQAKLEGKPSAV